jgi:hypothetical protein
MYSLRYPTEADFWRASRVRQGDDPTLPPLLFSIFAFARGIGNVTSGEFNKGGFCT